MENNIDLSHIYEDIAKLQQENIELRQRVETLEKSTTPEDLVHAQLQKEMTAMRSDIVFRESFDSLLSSSQEIQYILDKLKNVDMPVSDRQLKKFHSQVTKLRHEAARLKALQKEVQALPDVQQRLVDVEREISRLESHLE